MPKLQATKFYISTTGGQRIYYIGHNPITGTVELQLDETAKAESVVVSFIGVVRVDWLSTSSHRNASILDPVDYALTRPTVRQRERWIQEGIIKMETTVWKPAEGAPNELPAGTYSWPFSFTPPPDKEYPPSVNGGDVQIIYLIEARVNDGSDYSDRRFLPLTMIPVVDCGSSEYEQEICEQKEKTIGHLLKSGVITLKMQIASTSWCPGEVIPVHIHIENHSSALVDQVSINFHSTLESYMGDACKKEFEDLVGKRLNRRVAEGEVLNVIGFMRLPAVGPSFTRDVGINAARHYSLEVYLSIPHHDPLYISVPVVVGTIPHPRLPLLVSQMEAAENVPLLSWATVEQITRATPTSQEAKPIVDDVCKGMPVLDYDFTQLKYEIKDVFFMLTEPRSEAASPEAIPVVGFPSYYNTSMPPVFFAKHRTTELRSPDDL